MRKHAAVEYAKQKLSEEFLFPKQLTLANKQQINAIIQDGKLIIDGKQVSWFKEELNDEQKEAVAAALRGECRPFPFIIFGPPVIAFQYNIILFLIRLLFKLCNQIDKQFFRRVPAKHQH